MINIEFIDDNIIIKKQRIVEREENTLNINLMQFGFNKITKIGMVIDSTEQKNKVLLLEEIETDYLFKKYNKAEDEEASEEKNIIAVFSDEIELFGFIGQKNKLYERLIKFFYKVFYVKVARKRVSFGMIAYLINPYKLDIKSQKIALDETTSVKSNIEILDKKISNIKVICNIHKFLRLFNFKMKDILNGDMSINSNVNLEIELENSTAEFRIGKKDSNIRKTSYYYAPYKSGYAKDYAVHLRRTIRGNFMLVKRFKEPIEYKISFRIMESKIISFLMYHMGKIMSNWRKNKISLFYEKLSAKADEGAFDLFLMVRDSVKSKAYFIIDKNSQDYEKIKSEKNVVTKYSLKYYYLIYNCDFYIATEAPAHLNILRSNNKYFRKGTCEHKFIFLQHGITYLKCQGESSTFARGKEGEVTYLIVGSEKEREVCSDMLELYKENIWVTGLPIYSKISYNHLNSKSEDKIVVMLTWKSYDEYCYNFEESTYYKIVMEVYNTLCKYISDSNIIIIPHPKMRELVKGTALADNMWDGSIAEALEKGKLLITDYSSVCYNTFYQGGAVIFYQPDLEVFEKSTGKLIPKDYEYVGNRIFSQGALDDLLKETIVDDKINMSKLRTAEHEYNYSTINEFSDGKNLERIYEKLLKNKII